MSASERARRNAGIAAARASGLTWAAVAADFGVSPRTARQAVTDHRAAAKRDGAVVGLNIDPDVVLARVVDAHEFAMTRLRELAVKADNDSAKVGAARGAAAVGTDLVRLLADAGLVPQAVEWRVLRDVKAMAAVLLRAAEELGVDVAELMKRLDGERKMPQIVMTREAA